MDTVYKTTVNPSDGSISPWQQAASLPHPFNGTNQTVLVNNRIFTIGGGDNSGPLKRVFYSDINPDGSLQNWSESANQLPQGVGGGAAVYANGYIYSTGGFNGAYLNNVYYTKVNFETTLSVPLLKQTDAAWGGQLYDSANLWAPAGQQGITQWGCALTSAVMVLNYNGIVKLPDGTALNPATLNTWLKGQKDGYIGNGLVNWIALTRLSKLAKSKNPLFNFDALEYTRTSGFNSNSLVSDLKNNIPDILEVPGHFVVGTGTQGPTFTINDPFFPRTLLNSYSNTALAMGKYTPSNSDLSYLMLTVDDGIMITVKDQNGNTVGEGFSQLPLDEQNGVNLKSGPSQYFYYIPKPGSGKYTVILSSGDVQKYILKSFLYDLNGNVVTDSKNGIMDSGNPDTFTINFDKNNSSNSTISQNHTFDTLISDLDLFYSQGLLRNFGVYKAMREDALQAKKNAPKSKIVARAIMGSLLTILESNHNKTIDDVAYQILKPEVVFLQNSLK